MYIPLTDKWGERCSKRKKIGSIEFVEWHKSSSPLTRHVSSLGPVLLEKTQLSCQWSAHMKRCDVLLQCKLFHHLHYEKTQATGFSCTPNYYSIPFLVKSERALPLFAGGPELDLLWPKALHLNDTSIYSSNFVFRLIHCMAKLHVLHHRQNTFRLSIKRISDISALIHSCSSCPEAMWFAICYISSHNLAYKNLLCFCVVCCVGCGFLFLVADFSSELSLLHWTVWYEQHGHTFNWNVSYTERNVVSSPLLLGVLCKNCFSWRKSLYLLQGVWIQAAKG